MPNILAKISENPLRGIEFDTPDTVFFLATRFDNAHTDAKTTTFYFEVQRRKFRRALDMFAQFFIDPLMAKSAMTRERQAVDSEFQMALPSDYNKKQQLLGSVAARPNHPLGKFMWGNQESLSK